MTDISLAPLVSALAPIAIQTAGVVIAAAVAWAAARFHAATGVTIKQGALDSLTKAAQAEAGALVAAAGDNLATAAIAINSPQVADITFRLVRGMPDALNAAGLTPSNVATMVAGAIGELQARMTSVTPPATAPSAAS